MLEGMELDGEWSPTGAPGTRRPDAKSTAAIISPGVAIVTGRTGQPYLLQLKQEVRVPWPTSAGPAVRGVLVLMPRIAAGALEGGAVVAREMVSAELGFVKPEQATQPFLLPLASPIGNGRDWATDLSRIWQPEHSAIEILLKKLESLEFTVWKAEPEGGVWDRQILGRNWVRYQTVAASAIQAAKMLLLTKALTTRERVRLLSGLYDQLTMSVEKSANELLQIVGPAEGAGPYASIGTRRRGGAS